MIVRNLYSNTRSKKYAICTEIPNQNNIQCMAINTYELLRAHGTRILLHCAEGDVRDLQLVRHLS